MPKHIRMYDEGRGGESGGNGKSETHPFVPELPLAFVSPLQDSSISERNLDVATGRT